MDRKHQMRRAIAVMCGVISVVWFGALAVVDFGQGTGLRILFAISAVAAALTTIGARMSAADLAPTPVAALRADLARLTTDTTRLVPPARVGTDHAAPWR